MTIYIAPDKAAGSFSFVRYGDPSVPGLTPEQPTTLAGRTQGVDGTYKLLPGVYRETLRAEGMQTYEGSPSGDVVIDGEFKRRTIRVTEGRGAQTNLIGLTICNGGWGALAVRDCAISLHQCQVFQDPPPYTPGEDANRHVCVFGPGTDVTFSELAVWGWGRKVVSCQTTDRVAGSRLYARIDGYAPYMEGPRAILAPCYNAQGPTTLDRLVLEFGGSWDPRLGGDPDWIPSAVGITSDEPPSARCTIEDALILQTESSRYRHVQGVRISHGQRNWSLRRILVSLTEPGRRTYNLGRSEGCTAALLWVAPGGAETGAEAMIDPSWNVYDPRSLSELPHVTPSEVLGEEMVARVSRIARTYSRWGWPS